MTNSHSVFQGSASDFFRKNSTKHPKLKYNRDFKRQMCPTLRSCCSWSLRRENSIWACYPCTESFFCWLCPRIWSSLICICLSWLFQASLCVLGWEGQQECRGSVVGDSHHLQPPLTGGASTSICGTVKWHLEEKARGCVSAATPQTSIVSEEPTHVFLLVFLPSFFSLHAGVSVILAIILHT